MLVGLLLGWLAAITVAQAGPLAMEGMLPGGRVATGTSDDGLLSAGRIHTCAIKTDGSLACWGSNGVGQATPPTGSFTTVSAGDSHTCAIKTDGGLACWGNNGSGQATPPTGSFTAVSAGESHTCAIKTDGGLACWGSNGVGQATPPTGSFTAVSSGALHTCAIKTDGSLFCWGNNDLGQINIPPGSFTAVSAGGSHTCAIKTDGGLACWGFTGSGRTTPPAGSFTAVSAGGSHNCAIQITGGLACWGFPGFLRTTPPTGNFIAVSAGIDHTCALKTDGGLACWGGNGSGQATPPTGNFSRRAIAAGASHACEIRPGGGLACWGDNSQGQLNNIPAGTFTALSAGGGQTCAIQTGGNLACWGDNTNGQATPPTGTFVALSAGIGLASGRDHTCAIKTDGTLACWGDNSQGQRNTIPAGSFTALSAGGEHTCAIKSDSTLGCWGRSREGQTTPPAGTFSAVSSGRLFSCAIQTDGGLACWGGSDGTVPSGSFVALSAGARHTCAIKTDGTLACWGNDSFNQIGGTPTGTYTAVSTGFLFTCALRTDDVVVCWGDNRFGQAPTLILNPASLPGGFRDGAYSQRFTVDDNPARTTRPYTLASPSYSLTGGLPAGLSLAVDTLSGTPTVAGDFPISVRVADANGFAASRDYTLAIAGDTSPPTITPTIRGTLGQNGWYTSTVTLSWAVADPESAVASRSTDCDDKTVTTDTAGITFTCAARSLGGDATQSVTIKRDTTRPTASLAVSSGTLGQNGWYTSDVALTTSGTDATSGIASCSPVQNLTTDSAGTAFNGTCTDQAGNQNSTTTLTVKRDATPPTAALAVSTGTLGQNGWYTGDVTVQTSATDATSGIAACSADQFLRLDSAGTVFNGDCTDQAGNRSSNASLTVKRDATPPTAVLAVSAGTLGQNGWYTSDVSVKTSGTDALSGIATCSADKFLTSDSAGTDFNGDCTDLAGNKTLAASLTVKRDATPPTAALAVSAGTLGQNGWYTSDVSVKTSGTDALSGIAACSADQSLTSDSAGTDLNGDCTDLAGNKTSALSLTVKRDTTPPTAILAVSTGTLGQNGWYTSDVSVRTSGTDALSGIASCSADQSLTSDSAGTDFNGDCTDLAGNKTSAASLTVKRDATPPTTILAVSAGTLGQNGWYTSDVSVKTTGTDALSGIASCSADQVLNADSAGTAFNGACTDQAGNPKSAPTLTVKRDATAPTATLAVSSGTLGQNGWYTSDVTIQTSGTDALSGIAACSPDQALTVDTTGTDFNGACSDQAGNRAAATVLTLKRDSAPPVFAPVDAIIPVVVNGGTPSPTANDANSGLGNSGCTPVSTNTVGDYRVTCTTTDQAGNVSQQVVNYAVVYNFTGFERPLVNPPQLKRVSAGSRVRFRWRLTDANGQPVTSLSGARLDVEPLSCPIARRARPGATTNNGKTQFRNLGNGRYQLTWKTPKSYNASCKTVKLVLNEGGGQARLALFQFSRQRRSCELRPNGEVFCKP